MQQFICWVNDVLFNSIWAFKSTEIDTFKLLSLIAFIKISLQSKELEQDMKGRVESV